MSMPSRIDGRLIVSYVTAMCITVQGEVMLVIPRPSAHGKLGAT